MRVHLCGHQAAGQFANQLLAIEDGRFPTEGDTADVVQLPETMGTFMSNIDELFIYLFIYLFIELYDAGRPASKV